MKTKIQNQGKSTDLVGTLGIKSHREEKNV